MGVEQPDRRVHGTEIEAVKPRQRRLSLLIGQLCGHRLGADTMRPEQPAQQGLRLRRREGIQRQPLGAVTGGEAVEAIAAGDQDEARRLTGQ